jgi:predicted MFS family arabinose efflux permease
LLGGRAADLLGRRRLFMTGVLFFTIASLMCGLAWSPAALLAARVAQGVGAAIMTPTALSIIYDLPRRLRAEQGARDLGRARRDRRHRFGVGSVVLALAVTLGAIVAQTAVLKVGFRPVAATGMALMGAGSLLLTEVSVSGSYFGDIFFGVLVFGPGVGLVFVTATVAALAGVAEHESGLASGLSNTAFQIGAALGVGILTTVPSPAPRTTWRRTKVRTRSSC